MKIAHIIDQVLTDILFLEDNVEGIDPDAEFARMLKHASKHAMDCAQELGKLLSLIKRRSNTYDDYSHVLRSVEEAIGYRLEPQGTTILA